MNSAMPQVYGPVPNRLDAPEDPRPGSERAYQSIGRVFPTRHFPVASASPTTLTYPVLPNWPIRHSSPMC